MIQTQLARYSSRGRKDWFKTISGGPRSQQSSHWQLWAWLILWVLNHRLLPKKPIRLTFDRQWDLMLLGGFIKVWPIDWPWIWDWTWILRYFPGQLLFHPLKLSCEGRSIGLFIATTNYQQATQAGCARYWYALPRIIFFFSFFGITSYSLSFVI